MEKTIHIKCRGAGTLAIELLTPIQGGLKTLHDENFEKLKNEIIHDGFIEPISIWEDPASAKVYVLNGHQRLEVLTRMKADGWAIPPVPVNFVEAHDIDHAKRLVLPLTSQYGTINPEAAFDYVTELGLGADHLKSFINFADFDMDRFMKEFFVDEPEEKDRIPVSEHTRSAELKEDDFQKFAHKCPRCSFEFDEK